MIYNVFGSKSSQDRDVLVFLDQLPSLEECKKLSKQYNELISKDFADQKLVNSNFGILANGHLSQVFKGTVDEVNNSLFLTYKDHIQNHELMIKNLMLRDIELKSIRVARIILSFYSRTIYRTEIKQALSGSVEDKVKVLSLMNLSKITEFNKKQDSKDVYKNIAFQLGQIHGLWQGHEFYSKESISNYFTDLSCFLKREPISKDDLVILNNYKDLYVNLMVEKMAK